MYYIYIYIYSITIVKKLREIQVILKLVRVSSRKKAYVMQDHSDS